MAQQGYSHIANKSQDELVAALKANDEEVMKALYTVNYPKVEALVLQNNGSVPEAKDVFQEAFIAVWKNVRGGRFTPQNETSLSGYLYRIAKNKWLDILRSSHHKQTVSENRLHTIPLQNNEEVDELARTEKENITKIIDALGLLGTQCKNVLEQFYFERKSYREISDVVNMTEASVRNQKYRCMQKLRELVEKLKNH